MGTVDLCRSGIGVDFSISDSVTVSVSADADDGSSMIVVAASVYGAVVIGDVGMGDVCPGEVGMGIVTMSCMRVLLRPNVDFAVGGRGIASVGFIGPDNPSRSMYSGSFEYMVGSSDWWRVME